MSYRADKQVIDTHTDRYTDRGDDNTRRLKLASGNEVTFDFEVKFDLEGQGQSLPKTSRILTQVFYTYGPNLVNLAWTGDELSRRQAHDWCTEGHTHTDRRRQRQYPKAKTGLGTNRVAVIK